MVGKDEFQHGFAGIEHTDVMGLYFHVFSTLGSAGGRQVTAAFHVNHANAATAGFMFNVHIAEVHVAQGGDLNINLLCCLQDGCSFFDLNGGIIYIQFYFFHFLSSGFKSHVWRQTYISHRKHHI